MKSIVLAIVALSSIVASAQVSPEEAMRRLEERKMARNSAPATTAPASSMPANASPARMRKVYRPKTGAPYAIQQWLAEQPYLRRLELESEIEALAELDRQHTSRIASIKARVEGQRAKSAPIVSSGSGYDRREYVDRQAEYQWQKDLDQLRRAMTAAIKEREAAITAQAKKIDAMACNTEAKLYYALKLEPKVGSIGRIGRGTVQQVVDDKNMIVRVGETLIWLKGWSTSGLVDDAPFEDADGAIITGTKRYSTIVGGSKTVYVAEPYEISEYSEIVEEEFTPPPPTKIPPLKLPTVSGAAASGSRGPNF